MSLGNAALRVYVSTYRFAEPLRLFDEHFGDSAWRHFPLKLTAPKIGKVTIIIQNGKNKGKKGAHKPDN